MKQSFLKIFPLLIFMIGISGIDMTCHAQGRIQMPQDEKTVIVIDPGHGGENEGTTEKDHLEKSMTMITATAMYSELCLFDDVIVYLTREDDVDMSLKERAAFAKDHNADFLFSIHYNASKEHCLFGSEIWIPHSVPYNAFGYQFGYEFLSLMKEKGLFIRGIKTKLNEAGSDYYGIIREADLLGIPAVILEHCHVDEPNDERFCASEEDLIQFGKDDAIAVAKYFGLKSEALGLDYSEYSLQTVNPNKQIPITLEDETAPEICQIEPASVDYDSGSISFTVTAADYDSPLIYYDYSLDGGITYSNRFVWPGSDVLSGSYKDIFLWNLNIPSGMTPKIILRAYNQYDHFTESNLYLSPEPFQIPSVSQETDSRVCFETEYTDMDLPAVNPSVQPSTDQTAITNKEISFFTFLKLCFVFVGFLLLIILISQLIAKIKKRR